MNRSGSVSSSYSIDTRIHPAHVRFLPDVKEQILVVGERDELVLVDWAKRTVLAERKAPHAVVPGRLRPIAH